MLLHRSSPYLAAAFDGGVDALRHLLLQVLQLGGQRVDGALVAHLFFVSL